MLRFLPHTLRARLTALIVLSASIVLAFSGLAVYGALRVRIESSAAAETAEAMSALDAHLATVRSRAEIIDNEDIWADHLHGRQHMALAIYDMAGNRLLATAGFRDYAPIQDVRSAAQSVRLSAPDTTLRYLVRVVPTQAEGGAAIRVAIQYDRRNDLALLRTNARTIAAIEVLGVVLAAGFSYGVTLVGLTPLRRLVAQAEEMSTTRLARRLPELGGSGELRELGQAFNGMLARLDDSFTRLGEFSSNLAHDLRTPLTNLQVAAQIALAQPRSAQAYRDVIESSIDEYQRLSKMVDDMLFLARSERAESALSIREFDAAQEAKHLAAYYDSLAQDAGVAIEVCGQGVLQADLLLYQRAVSNLLANALAHAPPGSTIEIECRQDPHATTILVSDSGPGVAAQHLERIFERFYRVDPSRRDGGRGAGLGLAIVKSIMDNHKGTCGVTSEPHIRTTFWLRFASREDGGTTLRNPD
jgi:two-component system, OmpR family, heavy metal sensor histidine kinase CusS